jgi:hypothetical protein
VDAITKYVLGASARSQTLANHQKQCTSYSTRLSMENFGKPDFDPRGHFFAFDNLDKETKACDPCVTKNVKKQHHATLMVAVTARTVTCSNVPINLDNLRLLDPAEMRPPSRKPLILTDAEDKILMSRMSRSIEIILKEYLPGMRLLLVPFIMGSLILMRR